MGRNIIQTNLLQCRVCGEIFEAVPKALTRDDFVLGLRPGHDGPPKCQKCVQSSHQHQMKQIGDTFQSILMYCRNRSHGCVKELPSCDLAAHEIDCDYRPVRCIWHLQCEQKEISFCNYRKHLEKMHGPYLKKVHLNDEYDVVIRALRDHVVVNVSSVVCDEKNHLYFTRKCLIDLQKDLLMVCVHYVGERKDARKYLYRVRIHQGLDAMNACYEYSAYCAPCVETPSATDAHSHCILLHPKKLFLTDGYLDELKYSVTIRRVKERLDSN